MSFKKLVTPGRRTWQNLLIPLLFVPVCEAQAGVAIDVQTATRRGLDLVMQAASNWPKNRTCFSCHHQTLPMLAMVEASRAGFTVDPAKLKSQADITRAYFEARIGDMDEGHHVPGGAGTAAYGLWALSLDGRPADRTSTAIVTYLLQIQGVVRLQGRSPASLSKISDGRWIASCKRAPLQGSEIGDTVLALIGIEKYASESQRAPAARARAAAEKWLAQAPLKNQQDRLWRLWGLNYLGGERDAAEKTRAAILGAQHEDGGWAEAEESQSDAYSTAQTLFMLCRTGTPLNAPTVIRARDYLIRTQHADGSWLVESHQKFKAQPYFENGDPHGEHQFVSTAATAWATAALAQFTRAARPPPSTIRDIL